MVCCHCRHILEVSTVTIWSFNTIIKKKLNADLFSGTIEMSGGVWSFWGVSPESAKYTFELAAALGCGDSSPAEIKACFKQTSLDDIYTNTTALVKF